LRKGKERSRSMVFLERRRGGKALFLGGEKRNTELASRRKKRKREEEERIFFCAEAKRTSKEGKKHGMTQGPHRREKRERKARQDSPKSLEAQQRDR